MSQRLGLLFFQVIKGDYSFSSDFRSMPRFVPILNTDAAKNGTSKQFAKWKKVLPICQCSGIWHRSLMICNGALQSRLTRPPAETSPLSSEAYHCDTRFSTISVTTVPQNPPPSSIQIRLKEMEAMGPTTATRHVLSFWLDWRTPGNTEWEDAAGPSEWGARRSSTGQWLSTERFDGQRGGVSLLGTPWGIGQVPKSCRKLRLVHRHRYWLREIAFRLHLSLAPQPLFAFPPLSPLPNRALLPNFGLQTRKCPSAESNALLLLLFLFFLFFLFPFSFQLFSKPHACWLLPCFLSLPLSLGSFLVPFSSLCVWTWSVEVSISLSTECSSSLCLRFWLVV